MKTVKIRPSAVTSAHSYTQEDVPWELRDDHADCGRLAHYLSGGGMRTFGRTIAQQKAARAHARFWVVSAVFFAFWLLFYFI